MELSIFIAGIIAGCILVILFGDLRRERILENASESELTKHLIAAKKKRIAQEAAENQARKEVANL